MRKDFHLHVQEACYKKMYELSIPRAPLALEVSYEDIPAAAR